MAIPAKRFTFSAISLLAAALITALLFLLMSQLIHRDNSRQQILETVEIVNITPPQPEPEQQPQSESDEPPPEPVLPELQSIDVNVTVPTLKADIAPMAIQAGDINIHTSSNWAPPAVGSIATGSPDAMQGKGNKGFRVIEPLGSRQPNIPDIAWQNKIDGWVLVSFVVDNKGKVGKVQVMDAYPRGIFEEEVVAAVSRWIYPAFDGPPIQLTQKIELFWKNYPNNIRQLY